MPCGLKRYQQTRQLHFVTFSCYHRRPLLADPQARGIFVQALETVRRWYGFWLIGYVVMPEHVHLLLSEPERKNLALVLQMLKQMVCRKLRPPSVGARIAKRRAGMFSRSLSGKHAITISTSGASKSASRSCVIFTVIQ